LFQGTHHRLLLAGNGREALARIAEVKPTLVLMDIRMPVMDGRATLAAIRRLPGLELLPVLAVTASSHANDERDLRERFNGYLRKPFSRRQLYQELAQFLPRVPRRQPVVSPEPVPGTGVAVMATARSAATPEAAMNELKLLHQMQWPGLRDGIGINETTAFARRLRRIAQTIQSESLMLYADRLAANAQAYAVGELERNLAEFPALINSIQPPEKKN
jgi:CheY-like chemotaxis protein